MRSVSENVTVTRTEHDRPISDTGNSFAAEALRLAPRAPGRRRSRVDHPGRRRTRRQRDDHPPRPGRTRGARLGSPGPRWSRHRRTGVVRSPALTSRTGKDPHRREARGLVPSSGAISIDASSTMLRLATGIEARRGLTVLTNSVESFRALQDTPGVTTLLTGCPPNRKPEVSSAPSRVSTDRRPHQQALVHLCGCHRCRYPARAKSADEAEVGRERWLLSLTMSFSVSTHRSSMGDRSPSDWRQDQISTLVTELEPKDKRLDPYRKLAKIL